MTEQASPSPGAFMGTTPVMSGSNTPAGARYARELRDAILRQADRQPRNVQRHLGPSEIGVVCDRQVVGKFAGEPRTNNVMDPWASVVGTAVHAKLAEFFANENTLNGFTRWVPELRVSPHPLYPGTADLYDGVTETVVDWKILGPTSMAKVMSPAGPSRRYQVQLLLYAAGYRNLGLPVRRVALAALPRTSPTLDSMYLWMHDCSSDDDRLIADVLDETAFRREVAQRVLAGRINIGDVQITPSDDCIWCFSADTSVVTRDGIKPIQELAGGTHELLVPDTQPGGSPSTRGTFRKAEVLEFGQQRLWEIRLRNHGSAQTIYATAEHRWVLSDRPGRPRKNFMRTTSQLRPGDRLRSLRAESSSDLPVIPEAVARGFVFGDGSLKSARSAGVTFFDRSGGKYEALLPFFPGREASVRITGKGDTARYIGRLPGGWKQLPPLRESRAFLLSWLAGYFAADGHVTRSEGQVTLESASEAVIRHVRDIAAICGIGYGSVRSRSRLGYGSAPSLLWSICLRRRDLPDWFLIRPSHQDAAVTASHAPSREVYWTVESVASTDRIEPVYCAVVPGIESFGLAGDLMTQNCPFYRPESARDYNPGCPGHSPVTRGQP